MALALGHPVGQPLDVGLQAMHCQEAVSMRVVAMPVIARSEATKQSRRCCSLA